MSSLKFIHQKLEKTLNDGKKTNHEEEVFHGSKGLTIKYFHKEDDTSTKISVYEKDGKYFMKTAIKKDKDAEPKKEEVEIPKSDLSKELAKHKELKFALDYVKTQKGGASKKSTIKKKSSKKSTIKKSSKKTKKSSKK